TETSCCDPMSTDERNMAKLKLGSIPDDKPVRLTIVVSAELAALLRPYAETVGSGNVNPVTVERIVRPMLERFIRTDRAFMRTRRKVVDSTARVDITLPSDHCVAGVLESSGRMTARRPATN